MRRNWLANAALATAAISVPLGTMAGTAHAATTSGQQKTAALTASTIHKLKHKKPYVGRHRRQTFDQVAAHLAKTLVGDPYSYGGTSPGGFDCSGLTQYVYRHTGHGKRIPRTVRFVVPPQVRKLIAEKKLDTKDLKVTFVPQTGTEPVRGGAPLKASPERIAVTIQQVRFTVAR